MCVLGKHNWFLTIETISNASKRLKKQVKILQVSSNKKKATLLRFGFVKSVDIEYFYFQFFIGHSGFYKNKKCLNEIGKIEAFYSLFLVFLETKC